MLEFSNCKNAYIYLETCLETEGEKRQNCSRRSAEYESDLMEVLGVTFKIRDTSDILKFISEKMSEEEAEERIRWLTSLGEEFIFNGLLLDKKRSSHYTYNERIFWQKSYLIRNIKEHKKFANRQSFLSIWNPFKDIHALGNQEIPCSIGYHFIPRDNDLHMIYYMRSLDIEIWPNDVYLSRCVQKHFAKETNMNLGYIIFMIGCFHKFC